MLKYSISLKKCQVDPVETGNFLNNPPSTSS